MCKIADVQLDYYGKRMATASSDGLVKVFDVNTKGNATHTSDLTGHAGPVWQVAWSHPKYGPLLASCGFDGRVIVWREAGGGSWQQVHTVTAHTGSVNAVAFAPHELGLMLASASSDGSICVTSYKQDGSWDTRRIDRAHAVGVTGISWSPSYAPGSLVSPGVPSTPVCWLASSGCDGTARIWSLDGAQPGGDGGSWVCISTLASQHTDWVRDVSWCPNIGLPKNTIATCGQDGKVVVWTQNAPGASWEPATIAQESEPVWRVSWSLTGNILAVASGKNKTSLWKETTDGRWDQVHDVPPTST